MNVTRFLLPLVETPDHLELETFCVDLHPETEGGGRYLLDDVVEGTHGDLESSLPAADVRSPLC